jgi:hypothetical protein
MARARWARRRRVGGGASHDSGAGVADGFRAVAIAAAHAAEQTEGKCEKSSFDITPLYRMAKKHLRSPGTKAQFRLMAEKILIVDDDVDSLN